MNGWLKKNKEQLVPEIKGDFKSDHNEIRFKSPAKMTWNEWFWFSPLQYKFQYYGAVFFPMFFLLGGSIYLFFQDNYFFAGICFLLSSVLAWECNKRIKQYPNIKKTNMYDVLLRDLL
jgi:hypothetical protein